MREVEIDEETIRLGQLLKLAGIVGSGGEAKALLGTGTVSVNGELDDRRGRQVRRGDVVVAGGESVQVR